MEVTHLSYSVVKGTSYVLVHAPDMVLHNGTTQTTEKYLNPNSEYLKNLPNSLRSYDEAVNYLPNQVYIGNKKPADLKAATQPWVGQDVEGHSRYGRFGEIMPQDEFLGMIKIVDAFDLVKLSEEFTKKIKPALEEHALITEEDVAKLKSGDTKADIDKLINEQGAEPIYSNNEIVGCVKKAHDIDLNLSAHIIFENLVSKASGMLAAIHLVDKTDINPEDIEYVLECSEEACGDMNQRGGGNFAKAIAESAGLAGASGSDVRGFCAAPLHAIISAASMVQAGTFKHVLVVAGGSAAKLGMNGKDHVKKGLPILEDVIAGFAVLVSQNDGTSPVLRTDLVGRHTVGTGSSPQAVITSLVTEPLDRGNLKITDIDKYSVEMQNPDVTKPAGAGDVPTANYKMIAALGVKRGDIERTDLNDFIVTHGMEGWAPTQGHIPSGVPYVGFAKEALEAGEINKVMLVGKGSLFLGRMTNLFDGVSIVMEKNSGELDDGKGVSKEEVRGLVAEAMRDFASHLLQD